MENTMHRLQMVSLALLLMGFCVPLLWFPSYCLLCRKSMDPRSKALNIASAVLASVAIVASFGAVVAVAAASSQRYSPYYYNYNRWYYYYSNYYYYYYGNWYSYSSYYYYGSYGVTYGRPMPLAE
eukprot:INCI5623.2.p2 GENE.INCI5623.2~~INCI5623.2.p2  ORF type:complete len:125 (-),score=9.32 INCI5623.2:110-484(-)